MTSYSRWRNRLERFPSSIFEDRFRGPRKRGVRLSCVAVFERQLRQDVATDYSAKPHPSGRPNGRLATLTSPLMGVRDQDPGGRPESRLWAAVVERGQEPEQRDR